MFQSMPDEQRLEMFDAILSYQNGEEPEIEDPMVASVFKLIRDTFEANDEAYKAQCEKNKQIALEREAKRASSGNEASRTVTNRDEASRTVTDKDKDRDKDLDKEKKKSLRDKKENYSDDPKVDAAIKDFLKYRKEMRKPMGEIAISRFLNRLANLTEDPDKQVILINTAIERGWQTVYEPKENSRSGTPPDKWKPQSQRDYDYDDLERKLLAMGE